VSNTSDSHNDSVYGKKTGIKGPREQGTKKTAGP
jgi:hypothetical protein